MNIFIKMVGIFMILGLTIAAAIAAATIYIGGAITDYVGH